MSPLGAEDGGNGVSAHFSRVGAGGSGPAGAGGELVTQLPDTQGDRPETAVAGLGWGTAVVELPPSRCVNAGSGDGDSSSGSWGSGARTGWAWGQFGAPVSCLSGCGVHPPLRGAAAVPKEVRHISAPAEVPDGEWPGVARAATSRLGAPGGKGPPRSADRGSGARGAFAGGADLVRTVTQTPGRKQPQSSRPPTRTPGEAGAHPLTWPSGLGRWPVQQRCGPWPSCRGLRPSLWGTKGPAALTVRGSGPSTARPGHCPGFPRCVTPPNTCARSWARVSGRGQHAPPCPPTTSSSGSLTREGSLPDDLSLLHT